MLIFLSIFTALYPGLRSSAWEGLELMHENSLKSVPNKTEYMQKKIIWNIKPQNYKKRIPRS